MDRVRASASEPVGGDRGVRASASEPVGGDRGVRASEHEVLTIALQDGFEDDAVIVRIGDETVIDEKSVRTDQRIGLAYAVEVPRPDSMVTLEVRVPGRDLRVTKDVDARTRPFVGVSVLDGALVVTTADTPFGYG